ncbi:hypothetical protein FA014_18720 [Cellulomonas hominis]|uniref:Na+/H+ antiporter subunit C n=1 Tax=Cellulomonas hominis TaxID=156981 RepID=A0A7Z8JXS9_9CELL|nr:NADH-quinone oxidoreductase subunit K [Cellulomonas hominis]TKR22013.1 hypothetical protein FA014_18720 [Cellulomonas hominis]
MNAPDLFLVLGAVVTLLGATRLLTTRDHLRQVIALNVAGAGTLLVLVALGSDGTGTADPVLQALALTGIVITVAVTGLALVLVRRLDDADDAEDADARPHPARGTADD